MSNGKIISIFGSQDCGKTTLSVKLAKELAKEKKNVCIVMCDSSTPTLPTLKLHSEDISLGKILATSQITPEVINKNIYVVDEYIGCISYALKENTFDYPEYDKNIVIDFIVTLKSMYDYIIIDCVSKIESDTLSVVGLKLADEVIRIWNATPKSIVYFYSSLKLLGKNHLEFNMSKHINVVNRTAINQDDISDIVEDIFVTLPYIEKIQSQYMEHTLFESFDNSRLYREFNEAIKLIKEKIE